jgi:hypothetical protein
VQTNKLCLQGVLQVVVDVGLNFAPILVAQS